MNSFEGNWVDQTGTITVTVHQKDNIITSLTLSDGRGPFPGFEVDLFQPVICVDFTDDVPYTGVLAGSKILWGNGTVWTRA